MAEKVTMMKLKADLNCTKCCKKVKKTLAKFSQIKDKVFDESSNTVTIKVVCCNPEKKIMDKLCSKGAGAIKSIEIVPPKPEPTKPVAPVPAVPVPAPAATKTAVPEPVGPKPEAMMPAYTQGQIMSMYNGPNYESQAQSFGRPNYDSWGSGSNYEIQAQAYGRPINDSWVSGPSYEAQAQIFGRPINDSWGGGPSQGPLPFKTDYFSEENPQACAIM